MTRFETVGSTNDEAKAAARAGAVDGSVFWSPHQSAGRGTHGRDWATPPGNLAVSILKRPRMPLAFAPQAALVTAVAVAEALPELGVASDRIRLKWPNDVLVDGAKICGILMEGEAEGVGTRWLVIGTGLNLVHHPAETRHPATDLAALGLSVTPEAALAAYLTAFDRWWGRWRRYDFQVVATAWAARTLHRPGDRLTLTVGRDTLTAVYQGLAPDGALVIRDADGVEKRIVSGEIFTGSQT
ncbi:MAG: biotin--[acetyl-CoA-carboxylase] ligase [Alphaproteobacteria bacterium]|nr:biotin--[acetyl-CoA-carboxylase] ligase [Alphaproteobacteria bacterium]